MKTIILGIIVCIALITIALWMNKASHKSIKAFEYEEEQPGDLGSFEHSKVKTTMIEETDFDKEQRYLEWLNENKEDNDNKRKSNKTKK
jgi:FtsZ-interacting cell division protein ZipA